MAVLQDINKHTLPGAERKVADWVLAKPAEVVNRSLADVARLARVSEPTVIRFCRRLGFSGYRELKLRLAVELETPGAVSHMAHQHVGAQDNAASAAEKVLGSAAQTLISAHDHAKHQPFEAAVKHMIDARQWVFVGLGASGYVAQDAKHKFFRLGLPCATALDAQTIMQYAAIATAKDVFVAISHTGQWQDLVQAMSQARARGATVIALTQANSDLADQSTLLFETNTGEDTNLFTPMRSRLTQLATLDALQVGVALALGQNAAENLRLSKAAIHR